MSQDSIIEAVKDGRAEYDWLPISAGPVTLHVMQDALRIQGVRVSVTARTAQQVADLLGASLTTPRIEDLIYQQARTRIGPFTDPRGPLGNKQVNFRGVMVPGWQAQETEHSEKIDRAIASTATSTLPMLVATVGKSWCLSNKLTASVAMNYSWHGGSAPYAAQTLPGVKVWQQPGTRHNAAHFDYSQTLRLVLRRCEVDGQVHDLHELLRSPSFASLLSHEGVLQVLRQPGVPVLEPLPTAGTLPPPGPAPDRVIVLPEITITASPLSISPVVLAPKQAGDVPGVSFRQARHHTKATRKLGDVKWVVIHTAECGETKGAAEGLQAYAATMSDGRVASWHFAVDGDSSTQSVLEKDVAYHAPGANKAGIGIELAGRANQNTAGWDDDYSQAMLDRSAVLVAGICKRWGIPVVRIGPAELLAGTPGICRHVDVSKAFKKSSHYDPGVAFPWDDYLALVREKQDVA